MKRWIMSCIIVTVMLCAAFLLSCRKQYPTGPDTVSELKSIYSTSTAAWIKVNFADILLPSPVKIYKNGELYRTFTLANPDTLITVDGLAPNSRYNVFITFSYNDRKITSNTVEVSTTDTIAGNYAWTTFYLGKSGQSCCYQTAILDNNEVWAVGEFYLTRPDGSLDEECYNLAKWNGNEWKYERIYVKFKNYTAAIPLNSIKINSQKRAVFGSMFPIFEYKGAYRYYYLDDMGILNGYDEYISDFQIIGDQEYIFAGTRGSFVVYKDGRWKKIKTDTKLNITSICNFFNIFTRRNEVYCSATDDMGEEHKILRFNDTYEADSLSAPNSGISSVWTMHGLPVYITGEKVMVNNGNGWQHMLGYSSLNSTCIQGSSENNIFICGLNGLIAQYNGVRWHPFMQSIYHQYTSITVKENVCVVCGCTNDFRGVVSIGLRY